MKRILYKAFLTLAVSIFSCGITSAFDFESNSIYYRITSATDLTVEVTYKGSSYSSYDNEYSGSVIIPSTVTHSGVTYAVTSIDDYAFYYCRDLTEVTIPNSVTEIGYGAFSGCYGLTEVTIPNSVNKIKSQTFYGCNGITSVAIPSSVTEIGDWAFRSCIKLPEVIIPNSVTSIGKSAFEDCYSLTEATIPNSVTSIGDHAFSECTRLAEVKIGNSVTEIPWGAFFGCTNLTWIFIPNSVTSIGGNAFQNCSSLTDVTIPSSVTEIGASAFWCESLTKVICKAEVPPTCEYGAFYSVDMNTCKLYVPEASIDAYKVADEWKEFFFIEGIAGNEQAVDDDVTDNVDISVENGCIVVHGMENDNVTVEVYTAGGQLIYRGTDTTIPVSVPGIYIVKVAGTAVKVAVA